MKELFIGKDVVTKVIMDFGVPSDNPILTSTFFEVAKVIIPVVLISFPLCRQHSISSLQYPSLVAVAAVIFAIFVVILQSFYKVTWSSWENVVWFKNDLYFFQACAVTFFAYICQPSFLPVYEDLAKPTVARVSTVPSPTLTS